MTAGLLGTIGLVPGMPNLAFLTLAAAAGGTAWWIARRDGTGDEPPGASEEIEPETPELSWDDVSALDALGLEVGYRLIPLVDQQQGGQLMSRIRGVRKKASQELGFLVPAVHIRDNLELPASGYRISVLGVAAGEAEVRPGLELAINPGEVYGEVPGEAVTDPVFGLDAIWIDAATRDHAQSVGYTVVDADTVVATHLSQIVNGHAHLLLGHQEVQALLDRLAETHPKVVEDLVPKALPLAVVAKVLQNLLRDRVPVRDLRTIVECLAEHAPVVQDAERLTAAVRVSLGRFVFQHIFGLKREVPVITVSPDLDQILHASMRSSETEPVIEPGVAERLRDALRDAVQAQELAGDPR